MMMKHTHVLVCLGALTLASLIGCRPEPGDPDYASQEAFDFEREEPVVTFLPGPDPFEDGSQRLSMDIFYEGGASLRIPVDGVTRHFFIYADEFSGQLTFGVAPSNERIEGLASDEFTHAGGPWWGGGVHWEDVPQDLSRWGRLVISLRSDNAAFADVELAMEGGGGVGSVQAADYGYTNDGRWHTLIIPLVDFANQGVDLTSVSIPLRFGGDGGQAGDTLLMDNVYFSP